MPSSRTMKPTGVQNDPLEMEARFTPGLTRRPAVHVGSQTMPFFHGSPQEQAWEGLHLAATVDRDMAIVRNVDPAYLAYWHTLVGPSRVLSLTGTDDGEYLTQVILNDRRTIEQIQTNLDPDATLQVFFATPLEQALADTLAIPLHGSPAISSAYGTKSGIRALARDSTIPMPPGVVCSRRTDVREAIRSLANAFTTVAIKHDLSTGGSWSTRWEARRHDGLDDRLDTIAGGTFVDGRDTVIVEGWLEQVIPLGAHLELLPGREPIICAAWEQLIDQDGTSYIGARPLTLGSNALTALSKHLIQLAQALQEHGAVGSFAPDFLVLPEPCGPDGDIVLLLELNARVPATAFPLEIVKYVRGRIGAGFCAHHVPLSGPASFREVAERLGRAGLLITHRDSLACGVVPYNVGLLPWGLFDIVAMANSWEETVHVLERVHALFDLDGGSSPVGAALPQ